MPDNKTTSDDPIAAPKGDVVERPYEPVTAEENAAAEGERVDQIPDYHEKNPTLDTSGPAFDPEKRRAALAAVSGPTDSPPVPAVVPAPEQPPVPSEPTAATA